jgi:hypothetical protein
MHQDMTGWGDFFIDKRKLIIERNYSWREMKVKIS